MDASPYVPTQLGTKALVRLGDRLGQRAELSDAEEDLYRAFIQDADNRRVATQRMLDDVLAAASDALPRMHVTTAGRTKTRSTLVDKLERSPRDKLPSIRDVAGVRLVADCTLLEQGVFAKVLEQAMGPTPQPLSNVRGFTREPRVISRVKTPAHGYRAIHVVVWLGGRPVEIQIRTELQHMWAQFMELLCDRWGREARYGLPVDEPDDEVREIKQSIVDRMHAIVKPIAEFETASSGFGIVHINVHPKNTRMSEAELEAARTAYGAMEPHIVEFKQVIRSELDRIRSQIDVLDAAIATRNREEE